MSCSAASGIIASESTHRGQLTRFLARSRWQKNDFNAAARQTLLRTENGKGRFLFIVDATMFSQAGKKTQNVYSTGNSKRRPRKGRRYNQRKFHRKSVHSFTFGLLITPSGYRIPFQIPHYTKEYCLKKGLKHLTTAEAAAQMIRELPLEPGADVLVLGDTAYDAQSVREACDQRGYLWIFQPTAHESTKAPVAADLHCVLV
ncbi:MAG: transposase [Planctomycetaceae bacterium]|nr:transposase [Planctomycetaceae bacterium]